ncbi:MAG: MATE family efflux transporter [Clostridia bacterium]|nr:MATE family efflux transporter [Clostridia bacterium]
MQKENKMGYMPVGKLVFTMSLPMIISMLVQACYNIIDSIYISRFSEEALAAISYAFPAQNLMIGFATGVGVGVNALLSKSLGEKNYDRANRTAGNGLLLSTVSYILFLLFALFGAQWFISFQTKTETIIRYGTEYLTICCGFSFGIFGEILFERYMQATGRTLLTMFTQGLGAVVNIVLDPIFIFGYFGLPAMGAKGAAIATVIGQILAFLLAVILNHFKNPDVNLSAAALKPEKFIIGRILEVGIPSILMMAVGSLMTTGMNKILNKFSDLAVTVFGVYFKLQSFIFMPVFGLNNGVIPIIAFNYGARHRKRMLSAIKIGVIAATGFMILGILVMQLLPAQALSLFEASEEMLAIGVPALRIISISYIFAGACIAISSVFQALGHGTYSTIVSVARQLLILLPMAYLFSLTNNLNMVWLAYPIAEIMSITVTLLLFFRLYKKTIRDLPD